MYQVIIPDTGGEEKAIIGTLEEIGIQTVYRSIPLMLKFLKLYPRLHKKISLFLGNPP